MTLQQKILNRKPGILLYGLTPPKKENSPEKNLEISRTRMERLSQVEADGLILYDLQDEKSRIQAERPFPFIETLEPMDYYLNYLKGVDMDPVIYQCVGKYSPPEIENRLKLYPQACTVFVGAPSSDEIVKTSLKEACEMHQRIKTIPLGGVTIAERHDHKKDEHLRLLQKTENGCTFFISQCVYDARNFKNLLSDYYYLCREKEIEMKPVIMTVSPCGSLKTLDFLKWLGISIPRWIENDLDHSVNTLDQSLKLCRSIIQETAEFAAEKNIPLGINIESVSVRKEEVLASFELLSDAGKILRDAGLRK
jgi:hypothetical protein